MSEGQLVAGMVLRFIAMAFVGGWYAWESFVIKGFADAVMGTLVMALISVITAVMPAKRSRGKSR